MKNKKDGEKKSQKHGWTKGVIEQMLSQKLRKRNTYKNV